MSEDFAFEASYSDDQMAHGVPAATPWDVGEAQTFLKQLVAHGAIKGQVLAPGSGPGHNEIFLASHGFSVTGIDGSTSAVERAKANAESAGANVDFRVGDATTLDGFDAVFDTVIDSAFFHALTLDEDAQVRYLESLHRVTRPDARLYMCEFGMATSTAWSAPWLCPRTPTDDCSQPPAGTSPTWGRQRTQSRSR